MELKRNRSVAKGMAAWVFSRNWGKGVAKGLMGDSEQKIFFFFKKSPTMILCAVGWPNLTKTTGPTKRPTDKRSGAHKIVIYIYIYIYLLAKWLHCPCARFRPCPCRKGGRMRRRRFDWGVITKVIADTKGSARPPSPRDR